MKQLLTYFGLAYLISWTIWLPLYLHIFGINNLPVLPFQHAFGALGPFIASFLTTWIFLKKDGVKKLFAKCFLFGNCHRNNKDTRELTAIVFFLKP